jgi:hypothetical protein
MLSEGFPKWYAGVFVFRQVERARSAGNQRLGMGLKKSVGRAREELGRKATTSFIILNVNLQFVHLAFLALLLKSLLE